MLYEMYRDSISLFKKGRCNSNEHFHKSIELIYNTSADRFVYVDGKRVELKSGKVLFLMPYQVHMLPGGPENVGVCNVFPTKYSDRFEEAVKRKKPSLYVIDDQAACDKIGCYMTTIAENLRSFNDFQCDGYINLILGTVLSSLPFENADKKSDDFVKQVVTYVNEHYTENLTLDIISQRFGYSKYYFSHLFNQKFVTNLNEYVNRVRILNSLELTEQYRSGDIYYRVGFASVQQFITYFKKVMGCTPSKFNFAEYLKDHGSQYDNPLIPEN